MLGKLGKLKLCSQNLSVLKSQSIVNVTLTKIDAVYRCECVT